MGMIIHTSDNKRYVDAGTSDTLQSLYSTVKVRLKQTEGNISLAIKFLETGRCDPAHAQETARQFNLIRDALSQVPPNQAVYDMDSPLEPAPWIGQLSPIVTSCANLYTTADGKDLLFEIVSILTYAGVVETSVTIG